MGPVEEAKRDPRVQPLLREVRAHHDVRFYRSESNGWGTEVVGRIARIHYQQTQHPGGSLAHELLHVLVQHRGYRRLIVGVSALDPTLLFGRLVGCLDNELQHHKMYPDFARMGFAPEEFYKDDDCETPDHLDQTLASNPENIIDILPNYFTLIAPGGCLSPAQRAAFEARFMALAGGRFAPVFHAINAAIADWSSSDDYDAEPILRRIFTAIKSPCDTWFGHSTNDRPPHQGFFIDRRFSADESDD